MLVKNLLGCYVQKVSSRDCTTSCGHYYDVESVLISPPPEVSRVWEIWDLPLWEAIFTYLGRR
jgi:hypothetical protein